MKSNKRKNFSIKIKCDDIFILIIIIRAVETVDRFAAEFKNPL